MAILGILCRSPVLLTVGLLTTLSTAAYTQTAKTPKGSHRADALPTAAAFDASAGDSTGYDHIPPPEAVEGVGFFRAQISPDRRSGKRLGVLYTPSQDEHPTELWALIQGAPYGSSTFDVNDVPSWSIDIHDGLVRFQRRARGDVYHEEHRSWDQGDVSAYATNAADDPIHLLGFDFKRAVSLRAGREYVISLSILDGVGGNGIAGITQFPGELPSAVVKSSTLPEKDWVYASEDPANEFTGGISTRLVAIPDICPDAVDRTDSDSDGSFDMCEGCPFDANKTEPGLCGCGLPDDDLNGDAVPDGCGPIIAMRFVKRNPSCIGGTNAGAACVSDCDCDSGVCGGDIPPTNELVINPGGTVSLEFAVGGWGVSGERLWAINMALDTLLSFDNRQGGLLSIHGGDKCCTVDAECGFVDAPCTSGACSFSQGQLHPELYGGFFFDALRSDYLFHGVPSVVAPLLSFANLEQQVVFGGFTLYAYDAVPDKPPADYFGTMVLEVSPEARGTFVLRFLTSGEGEIRLSSGIRIATTLAPAKLIIQEPTCGNGECEPGEDELSCPDDCQIANCGDGVCDAGESTANCPADCANVDIPAASQWGLIALGLCLLAIARITFHRRRALGT